MSALTQAILPTTPPWDDLFTDIISVGAWNVDDNNYSLITDLPNLDNIDILADGEIEYGDHKIPLPECYRFGTSFATPRVMAEIVNFYEEYIYPLLEGTYSTIEQVWGSLVDPSEGYSGIVDYILDAISTPVEILFDDGTTIMSPIAY